MSLSSPGLRAAIACLWEASARKAGNVHPGRDFRDLRYADLVLSAGAIAPVLDRAGEQPVGQTILEAIQATRRLVPTNTNLGIVLLLAPLAAAPEDQDLHAGIAAVLDRLTVDDSRAAFQAIRLAAAAGLGTVPDQDIRDEPTLPFRKVMALATERDLIARQYATGFREVLDEGVPALQSALDRLGNLEEAIIFTHLSLLAAHGDSLIVRKRGVEETAVASRQSHAVLDAGWPDTAKSRQLFSQLDDWLCAVGHQRNPGTCADLVAACLFAALRQNIMKLPPQFPWTRTVPQE